MPDIVGKYRIIRQVGVGGFAAVFEAEHLTMQRRVAVKMLMAPPGHDDIVERFAREGRALAKLSSPYVVQVFDVGTYDGAPYLVMELVDGQDLERVLKARGKLSVADTLSVARCIAKACSAIHSAGVVHRDLKPSNLLALPTPTGLQVKLTDFGIAKIADVASMTPSHALLGSPRYMSPEQVRSTRDVDARADLWSVGVIVYRMLSGTFPFDGPPALILDAVCERPTPPVLERAPDAPPSLVAIVERLLEKDPARRYATAAALIAALDAAASPLASA